MSHGVPYDNEIGDLTLVRCLGHNELGGVWNAEDASGSRATVQLLERPGPGGAPVTEDVRMSQGLEHPNILHASGWVPDGQGIPSVIMEPFPGELLSGLLSREGPLPRDRGARIAVQVASAVEAAHEAGACHGALDAGFVLVSRSGLRAVVFGFGLERSSSVRSDDTGCSCDLPALCDLLELLVPATGSSGTTVWSEERQQVASLLDRGRSQDDRPTVREITTSLRELEAAVPRERDVVARPIRKRAAPAPPPAKVPRARKTRSKQPTLAPKVQPPQKAKRPPKAPRAPKSRRGRRNRRWGRIVVSVAAMLAVVTASAIGIASVIGNDPQAPGASPLPAPTPAVEVLEAGEALVPAVANLSVTDAREMLLGAGFTLAAVEPQVGPPGVVVASRPAQGSITEEGSAVTLLVGVDPERLETPDP